MILSKVEHFYKRKDRKDYLLASTSLTVRMRKYRTKPVTGMIQEPSPKLLCRNPNIWVFVPSPFKLSCVTLDKSFSVVILGVHMCQITWLEIRNLNSLNLWHSIAWLFSLETQVMMQFLICFCFLSFCFVGIHYFTVDPLRSTILGDGTNGRKSFWVYVNL